MVTPSPPPYAHGYGAPLACGICGAIPAVHAVVRGHRGLVVTLRFLTEEGAFCRTCGTATYRRMTSDTLWQGWWGLLSVFAAPVTLLLNLGARSRIRSLPHPVGNLRPPLAPGRPVLLRLPALAVMTALVIGLGVVAVPKLVPAEQATFTAGDCGRNRAQWPEQDLEVVGCSSKEAEFWISDRERCWGKDWLLHLDYSPENRQLCAHPMEK
ncbi:hypothetical protein [Streptomyces sp. B1I3]|uniref:hypothetical protein n=1 Tax=Streptomyces sp. B1I3 TaxID=3042264 RepID=UPI00278AC3D4|nr:hypothetical protein [Streptomyces sp. B1I3]MDQ0793666.1 hypothetical protein [Streptomyces sp. B1I3]